MQVREDHYENLREKKYVSLVKARQLRTKIDWNCSSIIKPTFLGTQTFLNYDLGSLVDYIDWKPFFDTWQLRGKYPNSRYPKIFEDKTVGEEARKLFADAENMLKKIVKENLLEARGIVGFYPASSTEDDIIVYGPEDTGTDKHRF